MGENLKNYLQKQRLIEQGFTLTFKTRKIYSEFNLDFSDLEELLRNNISKDPAIAKLLTTIEKFLSRRPLLSAIYYETFKRENVTLIDVSEYQNWKNWPNQ